MKLRGLAIAALAHSFAASVHAQSPQPVVAQRITIHSYWGGLNPQSPFKTDLLIERIDGSYRLSGRSSHSKGFAAKPWVEMYASREVPADAVSRLVEAMSEPLQPQADIASLGLTDNQLQQTLDRLWKNEVGKDAPSSMQAKAASLRQSLKQPVPLAAVVTRGFSGFHTDDYPSVAVQIELADHTVISASSRSQQPLMLPWTIGSDGTTYSPAISSALQALLPDKATNRGRMEGPVKPDQLEELLDSGLTEPFNQLRAEALAGDALTRLETHFIVSQPAYIAAYEKRGPQIEVALQRFDSPKNLALTVWLPVKNGALVKPDSVIARLDAQLALAQTAPGMAQRMRAAPHTSFTIRDRADVRSPYRRIAAQFVAQMHAMHRLADLKSGGAWMQNAVWVDEGNLPISWVVLPDHRAILWKRYSRAAATAGTMRCASQPDAFNDDVEAMLIDLCEGIVYDAEGRQVQP